MKHLKEKFNRKGIIYTLIERSDKVAFFSLTMKVKKGIEELVGYEVCKIYFKSDRTINGRMIEGSESIPSDDQFAWDDASKSFFPNELERATNYFKEYVLKLSAKTSSNRLTIMPK